MRAWPKIVQRDDVRRQCTPTMVRRRVTFRELQEEDEKIRARAMEAKALGAKPKAKAKSYVDGAYCSIVETFKQRKF